MSKIGLLWELWKEDETPRKKRLQWQLEKAFLSVDITGLGTSDNSIEGPPPLATLKTVPENNNTILLANSWTEQAKLQISSIINSFRKVFVEQRGAGILQLYVSVIWPCEHKGYIKQELHCTRGPPLVRSSLVRFPLLQIFIAIGIGLVVVELLCRKISTNGNLLCSTHQYKFPIV